MFTIIDPVKQNLVAGAGYGEPVKIRHPNATVTAIPGGGGNMDVQFSTSTETEVNANGGTWQDWPTGNVTATTSDTLIGRVTAVRARAVTAAGVLEVTQ